MTAEWDGNSNYYTNAGKPINPKAMSGEIDGEGNASAHRDELAATTKKALDDEAKR